MTNCEMDITELSAVTEGEIKTELFGKQLLCRKWSAASNTVKDCSSLGSQ